MSRMHIYTAGSAMENEPRENLADNFEHGPNEPATRNDLRTLATLVDRRFAKVDSRFDRIDMQFLMMQTMIKEELSDFKESMRKDMSDFRESMRKEMFRFAGFLTFCGLTALGIFAAAFR
jgi:cell division protein ZapA (FtsZ GTPase activity inhibitor)